MTFFTEMFVLSLFSISCLKAPAIYECAHFLTHTISTYSLKCKCFLFIYWWFSMKRFFFSLLQFKFWINIDEEISFCYAHNIEKKRENFVQIRSCHCYRERVCDFPLILPWCQWRRRRRWRKEFSVDGIFFEIFCIFLS